VGFVLHSTGISNRDKDRAMGHCLWMDGWTGWMTGRMDGKLHKKTTTTSFTICNGGHLLVLLVVLWGPFTEE